MMPVLEAVPNLSFGRDTALLERCVELVAGEGAEVLDYSSDPDHNRSVLTFIGAPPRVESAAVALARWAAGAIDLRDHTGVHPRVGALDVLPFVPLAGLDMTDAVRSARRVGARIAEEVGIPVYFYGEASTPPRRRLADLRRGGFEALVADAHSGSGETRRTAPDLTPGIRVHPTAGVVCVGARPLLLAWNIDVEGLEMAALKRISAELRGSRGGIPGLQTLGLELPGQGRMQISMNLEDAGRRDAFSVFRRIEERVEVEGGRLAGTEIIGMCPDELVARAGADRLATLDRTPPKVLSSRVAEHRVARIAKVAGRVLEAARASVDPIPAALNDELTRLSEELSSSREQDETG
ncbi:MAG: glutamate formimidoyltransferase [Gemmatimonadales bacterium]|nr:MAG: glutamate formimidoyltransferase [Gemmatimonadales bacterium]